MFSLKDKVAVITGSTRGIGLAIARFYAQAGAKVVISSRKADACERVTNELLAQGHEAIAVPCNVSDKAQLQNLVDRTLDQWGRIDILVCNAATNPIYGPLAKIADDAWEKVMATNVQSVLWLCNMVLPGMAQRGGGSVIMVSSIAAIKGNAVIGAYAVSKAAEAELARCLAVEWGPSKIRVNAIAPGLIKTDFARALWEDPVWREQAEQKSPLRRLGEPEDIAGVALFLASDASSFVTGHLLVADGGETIC